MNCAESRHLLQYKVLSSLLEAGSVVIGLMSLRRPCVHVAHAGTSGSGTQSVKRSEMRPNVRKQLRQMSTLMFTKSAIQIIRLLRSVTATLPERVPAGHIPASKLCFTCFLVGTIEA